MKPTRAEVEACGPWFQEVPFACGTVGSAQSSQKYERLLLGVELEGKTVIDIGCNSGVGVRYMEAGGATVWPCDVAERFRDQYALVQREFGLTADYHHCSVYDIATTADIVIFAGVYYHLRYPLLGLDKAWAATKELLVVEGAVTLPNDERQIAVWDGYDAGSPRHHASAEGPDENPIRCRPTVNCLRCWLQTLPGCGRIDWLTQFKDCARHEFRVWREGHGT